MNATNGTSIDEESMVYSPAAYKALILTTLVIASIAATLSATVVVAMTLPLLSSRRRKQYSAYNLYLAYLSFPDLIVYSYIIHLILTRHDSNFEPKTDEDGTVMWMFEDNRFDHNVYALCVPANLYTNAFLIYEIYKLLYDSSKIKRHPPPQILSVTKQAMIGYGMGIFAFLLEFFLSDILEGEGRNIRVWFYLYQTFSFIIFVLIPLSVLLFLWVRIHRQGLVESTGSMYDGRLLVLVRYFVRIVVCYLALWLPACISYMVYWLGQEITQTKVITYTIFLLMSGSQATVNFILSLTKLDTRKYIINLFVCEYCRKPPAKTEEDTMSSSAPRSVFDPYLGMDEKVELKSKHLQESMVGLEEGEILDLEQRCDQIATFNIRQSGMY